MSLPLLHGRSILKRVMETGLSRHLTSLGFKRRHYTFTRVHEALPEHLILSARYDRALPGQVFWLMAAVSLPYPAVLDPFTFKCKTWVVREDLDVGDFAVTIAELVHREFVPALVEARDPHAMAMHLRRNQYSQEAADVLLRHGLEREAEQVLDECEPPF